MKLKTTAIALSLSLLALASATTLAAKESGSPEPDDISAASAMETTLEDCHGLPYTLADFLEEDEILVLQFVDPKVELERGAPLNAFKRAAKSLVDDEDDLTPARAMNQAYAATRLHPRVEWVTIATPLTKAQQKGFDTSVEQLARVYEEEGSDTPLLMDTKGEFARQTFKLSAAPSIVIMRGDEVIYVESGHGMVQKRNEQDVNEVLEMIKVALRQ